MLTKNVGTDTECWIYKGETQNVYSDRERPIRSDLLEEGKVGSRFSKTSSKLVRHSKMRRSKGFAEVTPLLINGNPASCRCTG